MKKFLQSLKVALNDLMHGRPVPEQPTKVLTVEIQKSLPSEQSQPQAPNQSPPEQNQLSVEEKQQITSQAILNQPNEKLVVLPFDDPQLLAHFADHHKDVVYKYLLKRITKAIKLNWSEVTIFQFGSSQKIAQIGRAKFEAQLTVMMDWFVSTEHYELAGNCRDLIKSLNSVDVVDQTM